MALETDRKNKLTDNNLGAYAILFGLYVGATTIAGPHGAKLAEAGPFTFDAGLITYAMAFLFTDIVTEVYGKRYAIRMVLGGLCAAIFAYFATQITLTLSPSPSWELNSEYNAILGAGSRVFMAVIATIVCSQLTDLFVYSWVRKKTGAKYLWLRNNVSTFAGGFVDVVVFTTVAFYGVFPIMDIIVSATIVRMIIAVCDTPLVYLAVYILHKRYPELRERK